MNILHIDNHFCVREGVALLLQQILPDVRVFEAQDIAEGLALARITPLNLVLLDTCCCSPKQTLDGLSALRREFPCLCVVMFSAVEDRDFVFESLRLGAMGFIPKAISRSAFIAALHDVLSGRPYLPLSAIGDGTALAVREDVKPDSTATKPYISDRRGLTPREFDVLRWVVQGKCNKDIARHLRIEEQTVKNHLRPIFQKFGVTRRAELIVQVFAQGITLEAPEAGN